MEEHTEAVQRMQDYIEQNLDKDITMAELAEISGYSPWYSYRLFVNLLDAGFDNADGFQRAFYKEFGCNPYEYSICPTPIYLFKPYGIKYSKKNEVKRQKITGSIAKRSDVMYGDC